MAALSLSACGSTGTEVGRHSTVLLVTSGDEAEGSEASRALRRRLDERGDLDLQGVARLAALAAEDEASDDEAAELEAQRRLARAEDAFSRFDYAGATTEIGEALELLRPLASRATGRQRLAGIHLQLAEVLQVHGERDAALEEIRTCVHLDPDCAPDPARHPPELVALFSEAREDGAGGSSLHVDTRPSGARVWLDGQREARAPTTWDDVAPGRHYVILAQDGFLSEVQVVSVAAGGPTERRFALTSGPPSTRAAAALRALEARGPEAPRRWRAEAASLTEADFLLVLRLDERRLHLAAFDARGRPLLEPLEGEVDDGDAARAYLERALPEATVPFYGQWWFWTPVSVGLAVVLAAVGIFVTVEPSVQLVGGTVTP